MKAFFIKCLSSAAVLIVFSSSVMCKEDVGSVLIISNLAPFHIYIDGDYYALSEEYEFTMCDIDSGYHNIAIQKEGYEAEVNRVMVKVGQTLTLKVELVKEHNIIIDAIPSENKTDKLAIPLNKSPQETQEIVNKLYNVSLSDLPVSDNGALFYYLKMLSLVGFEPPSGYCSDLHLLHSYLAYLEENGGPKFRFTKLEYLSDLWYVTFLFDRNRLNQVLLLHTPTSESADAQFNFWKEMTSKLDAAYGPGRYTYLEASFVEGLSTGEYMRANDVDGFYINEKQSYRIICMLDNEYNQGCVFIWLLGY